MMALLGLGLVVSVFAGTVGYILVGHVLVAQAGGAAVPVGRFRPASRLRRVRARTGAPGEAVPGPTWASFPRAL